MIRTRLRLYVVFITAGLMVLGCAQGRKKIAEEPSRSLPNEPAEFRGHPWGMTLESFLAEHPSAHKMGIRNCSEIYGVENDSATLNDIPIEVRYFFSQFGLNSVDVFFSEDMFPEIREVLKARFGEDKALMLRDGGLVWWGRKVLVVLKKKAKEVGKSVIEIFDIALYDKSVEQCRQRKADEIETVF